MIPDSVIKIAVKKSEVEILKIILEYCVQKGLYMPHISQVYVYTN